MKCTTIISPPPPLSLSPVCRPERHEPLENLREIQTAAVPLETSETPVPARKSVNHPRATSLVAGEVSSLRKASLLPHWLLIHKVK